VNPARRYTQTATRLDGALSGAPTDRQCNLTRQCLALLARRRTKPALSAATAATSPSSALQVSDRKPHLRARARRPVVSGTDSYAAQRRRCWNACSSERSDRAPSGARRGSDLLPREVHRPARLRHSVRVGGHMPATCTAVGKAILADNPSSAVVAAMRVTLARRTPHAIREPQPFVQQLVEVRRAPIGRLPRDSPRGSRVAVSLAGRFGVSGRRGPAWSAGASRRRRVVRSPTASPRSWWCRTPALLRPTRKVHDVISWFERTWRRIKDWDKRNRYRRDPPPRDPPKGYMQPPPSGLT
jgi:Bacterial transcriptional regulator